MAQSPLDDAAARLDAVVDNVTPQEECLGWLIDEMRQGADPDELAGQLLANGWAAVDVDQLVDTARKRTREARSVLSRRNEVAAQFTPRQNRVAHTADITGVAAGAAIFAAGKAVEGIIGQETNMIRDRIKHGLCHNCCADVKNAGDRCPQCGSAVIRRAL